MLKCVKIKNGKVTKIPNSKCNMQFINKLLDKGFTVSKVIEIGNHTKIETFSPRKREAEGNWIREAYKQGIVEDEE